MKKTLVCLLSLAALTSYAQSPNTLSKKEKKAGFKLLFDGKTTTGWHKFNGEGVGNAWVIEDGALKLDAAARKSGAVAGDIVTDGEYGDFELKYESKIAENGNSGVMFHVVEAKKYHAPYFTGPEIQVLDNERHSDNKLENHRAGSLYDLIPAKPQNAHPAGQWNSTRVVLEKGKFAIYQNDVKVVETDMNSPEYKELVAKSKFKAWPDFGKAAAGHFCLQDHGDTVWFRNIKVREIK